MVLGLILRVTGFRSQVSIELSTKLNGKGQSPEGNDEEKRRFWNDCPFYLHDPPLKEVNGMESAEPKDGNGDYEP